jgi:hypothetical protein
MNEIMKFEISFFVFEIWNKLIFFMNIEISWLFLKCEMTVDENLNDGLWKFKIILDGFWKMEYKIY